MSSENRGENGRSAYGAGQDWNEGMEEMDDFTVRGGPAGSPADEDITGAANTERPLDPMEDTEGDEPTLRPPRSRSLSGRRRSRRT